MVVGFITLGMFLGHCPHHLDGILLVFCGRERVKGGVAPKVCGEAVLQACKGRHLFQLLGKEMRFSFLSVHRHQLVPQRRPHGWIFLICFFMTTDVIMIIMIHNDYIIII